MPKLSLKEYQEQVEDLLDEEQFHEAVHHSRHILKTYSKNARSHQQLARALLGIGELREAEQEFKRVLSVYPDDKQTSLGLSAIAAKRKNYDEAIWYMERAYEQNPKDTAVREQLIDMYREYRRIKRPKLKLTPRAVAEQQAQGGLLHKAVDTLEGALERSPKRIDLRLTLAKILWEGDNRVESAEVALDILKQLPNCVEANKILTQLWLNENRPSDAQRYLSHIETVAPYLAFQLAQGAPPPEGAFSLEVSDYTSIAKKELASREPDWLESLTTGELRALEEDDEEDADEFVDFDTVDDVEDSQEDLLLDPDDSEWMQEIEDVQELTGAPTRNVPEPDEFDFLNDLDLDDIEEEDDSVGVAGAAAAGIAMGAAGLAGLFDDDEDDEEELDVDEFPDIDTLSFGDQTEPDSQVKPSSGTGLTGWLENQLVDDSDESDLGADAGTGLTGLLSEDFEDSGSTGLTGLLGDDDDRTPEGTGLTGLLADEDDPLDLDSQELADMPDWLSGDEMSLGAAHKPTAELDPSVLDQLPNADEVGEADEEVDPLAWMQDAGIEILEESDAPDLSPYTEEEISLPVADPLADNPMAWMRDAGIEMDSDEEENAELDWLGDAKDGEEVDPLAWMQDAGIEWVEGDNQEDDFTDEDMGESDVNALDFMQADEQDEYTTSPQAIDLFEDIEDGQGTMANQNDDMLPDWLNDDSDDDEQSDDGGALDWLDNPEGDDEEEDTAGGALDWMSEPGTEDESEAESLFDSDDTPDWMSEVSFDDADDDEAEEPAAKAEGLPDWLNSDDSDEEEDSDEPLAAEDTPDWLLDGEDSSDDDEFEEEDDLIEPEDTPDWLAAAGAGAAAVAGASMLAGDDDEDEDDDEDVMPAWLLGDEDEGEESEEFEFVAEAESDEDESDDDDTPDWLLGDEDEDEDEELEFVAEAESDDDDSDDLFADEDSPDWLLGDEDEDEDEELEFIAEAESDDDDSDDLFADEDTPDWLLGDEDEDEDEELEFVAEAESDEDDSDDLFADEDTPDWLLAVDESEEDDEDEDDIEPEDTPDWLTAAAGAGAGAAAVAGAALFGGDDDESEDEDEELEFVAEADSDDDDDDSFADADAPDWLFSGDDEDEAFDEEELEPEDTPDWLAAAGAAASVVDDDEDEDDFDTPDWLADVGDAAEEVEDEEEFAFLAEEDGEDEEDAPDWLGDVEEEEIAGEELDFTVIEGIGEKFNNALIDGGITSFEDLAEASEQDIIVALRNGGVKTHPASISTWAEQAQYVVNDDWEGLQKLQDLLIGGVRAGADDLTVIEGVGKSYAAKLYEAGFVTYEDVAEATPEALWEALQNEGVEIRPPSIATWPEQAAMALKVKGDTAEFEAYKQQLFAGKMPESAAEEITEEEEVIEDEAVESADEGMPEWLSQTDTIAAIADIDDDDEEQMPSWLGEVEDITGEYEQVELEDGEDIPEWLDEVEASTEDDEAEGDDDAPDWLTKAGAAALGGAAVAGAAAEGVFDGLGGDDEEEEDEDSSIFDAIEEDQELLSADVAEEVDVVPADNAPDWLNAMVPGLDVDYDADDEDEPIESEFAPSPADETEFDWLSEIVDEELAPPSTLPPTGVTAAEEQDEEEEPRQPHFRFSRPPLWLRKLRERLGGQQDTQATQETNVATATASEPDESFMDEQDDDEDALPPWLEFDEDDEN